MKKAMAAIMLAAALTGTPLVPETIKMAVFLLEPFMMEGAEGEGPTGVTVEYWRSWIAPRLGAELEVLGPFPIKRAEALLEAGEVDTVSQLTKIPEREAKFLFPGSPLTTIESCVAVLADSPIRSVESPAAFYGKKVGFIESAFVPPFMVDPRITLELVTNTDYRQLNVGKLLARRLDAILDINYLSFAWYLADRGLAGKLRIMMLPVPATPVYSLFRKDARGEALRSAFDRANREGAAAKVFEGLAAKALGKAR